MSVLNYQRGRNAIARFWTLVLLAALLATAVAFLYRHRAHKQYMQNEVAEAKRPPIAVPGVAEPAEMLVEPFPKASLTEPEKMLGGAMNTARGNSDPNALLPALNRVLDRYPDYADGYVMRLGSLCTGKDRAAIVSDINNALRYQSTSGNPEATNTAMLSMRAKTEHDAGDDVTALRDLHAALQKDIENGTNFTNSGAVAPEKSTSLCTWSEGDMDELTQRFPANDLAFLFAGLYYGFFTIWNEASIKPAMENLDKAAELSPNSALPHFFKAHILKRAFLLRYMSDAQRTELNQQLLSELNKALALDPNLKPALSDRAQVYFDLKQFRQAIADYDKIIVLNPKDSGAFNDRGMAKMELGETYDAILDFGEAITLKPRELLRSNSYENRADAYLKTQEWPLAIQDLTSAISLQTGGVTILMNINQFRAIYPEYKIASDEAVTRKLNQTFFPDLKYEDFSQSFLHDNAGKRFYSSTIIPDLYVKRSDAYLKAGEWHAAAIDFRRAANGFPESGPDRWRPIGQQQNSHLYIDMQTFDDSLNTSMKLWTKQIDGTADSSGPYSLNQYEFNCSTRQLRILSSASYGATGNILATHEGGKWEGSIPDSLGETLLNNICNTK